MARERTKSRNWYHNTEILSSRRGCPLPYQGLAGKTPLAYRLPPPAPRDGQQHHAILIRLIPIAKQGCCDVERPRSGTEKIPNLWGNIQNHHKYRSFRHPVLLLSRIW